MQPSFDLALQAPHLFGYTPCSTLGCAVWCFQHQREHFCSRRGCNGMPTDSSIACVLLGPAGRALSPNCNGWLPLQRPALGMLRSPWRGRSGRGTAPASFAYPCYWAPACFPFPRSSQLPQTLAELRALRQAVGILGSSLASTSLAS